MTHIDKFFKFQYWFNMTKKNVIYYIAYLFISTFILTEIILRLFDPFGTGYLFAIESYKKTYKKDADFYYINQPGFSDYVQGVKVDINSEGLRSPQFIKNSKVKRRILILGDSIVFGWGVAQDSIFIYRLYKKLIKEIEIIGAGTNSWNTRAQYEFLKKEALAYQADNIILIINPNDIYLKSTLNAEQEFNFKRTLRNSIEELATYSYTTSTFLAFYQKYRHARLINDMFESAEAIKDVRSAFTGIISLCAENNIILTAFLYGNPHQENVKKCAYFYKEIMAEHGLRVNFFTDHRLFSGEFTNSFIDGHPNIKGHKIITKQLEETIRKVTM